MQLVFFFFEGVDGVKGLFFTAPLASQGVFLSREFGDFLIDATEAVAGRATDGAILALRFQGKPLHF